MNMQMQRGKLCYKTYLHDLKMHENQYYKKQYLTHCKSKLQMNSVYNNSDTEYAVDVQMLVTQKWTTKLFPGHRKKTAAKHQIYHRCMNIYMCICTLEPY